MKTIDNFSRILLVSVMVGYLIFGWVSFNTGSEVMADGITISTVIVTVSSVAFSILSWFLFSWATHSLNFKGIMLSVITGVVLITPFSGVLGPMAAVLVGLVAGFVAHMIQKKIICPTANRPLIIGAATAAASYSILFAIILSVQTTIPIWNT
jgi:ammonia channel protein AmtB